MLMQCLVIQPKEQTQQMQNKIDKRDMRWVVGGVFSTFGRFIRFAMKPNSVEKNINLME